MPPLPPPSPLPDFVYKITPTSPPDPIPEQYPLSELDRQDGFVHLSASWQARLHTIPYRTNPLFSSNQPRLDKPTGPDHSRSLLWRRAVLLSAQAAPRRPRVLRRRQVGRGRWDQRLSAPVRQLWRAGRRGGA